MLIESDRHTPGDLVAWATLSAADAARGRSIHMRRIESSALRAVERFLRDPSECYASVSWGKDSVVVAHLVRRVEPTVPLVHVTRRAGEALRYRNGVATCRIQNPDCDAVRDAFLALWPMPYCERERVVGDESSYAHIVREFGDRRIMGIRSSESGTRALSAKTHGISTKNVCRPILNWSTDDVFAYLARHDLPVHPAYAMSMSGELDRSVLRVASIGGHQGVGMGRRAWERRYYRDCLSVDIGGQRSARLDESHGRSDDGRRR